jgi:hypothetical protein
MFYFVFFIIFLVTFCIDIISVLYTESFILFLAFFVIFAMVIQNTKFNITHSKEDIKWNELIRFYISLKNWNRSLIRDRSVRIYNFVNLFIQIKKYELIWINRNLSKLSKYEVEKLNKLALNRLYILSEYEKQQEKINPLSLLDIYND